MRKKTRGTFFGDEPSGTHAPYLVHCTLHGAYREDLLPDISCENLSVDVRVRPVVDDEGHEQLLETAARFAEEPIPERPQQPQQQQQQ
jgi:hypothetical protein